ncbi:hypothetical protein IMCC21224_112437 [Puniceibacterium sp. IMCC21224]|nr:hypothetical protein IMCC21224_112437 [Puniceibacterium sp. IMCC21224]
MRPVVACPFHGVALEEIPAPDPVNAFDLPRLFAQQDILLNRISPSRELIPGALQNYVIGRLSIGTAGLTWLDEQDVWQAVKACEMLGALIEHGPDAKISEYSEEDWARVGDIGFEVCAKGPSAILDAFGTLRVSAGRSSGRAGPQAAFGFLFIWMNYSKNAKGFDQFRDVLREAIVQNFAIGPGEVILGQEVLHRRVHSVNSLVNETGINRFRLYRLMRKTGLIPATTDDAAFNQWVFPAEKGEQLIARIQNSIPLNKVQHVLGCSKTHAEQMSLHGVITSIVPISEGQVGLTQGYFNHDDLEDFKASVFRAAEPCSAEVEGFVNLTVAAKGRSSTVEILRWHLDGQLTGTRLLNGVQRIDHMRFDLMMIRDLVDRRRGPAPLRLTAVALTLGISLDAVKKLVTAKHDGPWLKLASKKETVFLSGGAYVSRPEIARFQARYTPLASVSRQTGIHFRAVQRLLEQRGIQPVLDPAWLGARIYRPTDVSEFITENQRMQKCGSDQKQYADSRAAPLTDKRESVNIGDSGESDDVICESDALHCTDWKFPS